MAGRVWIGLCFLLFGIGFLLHQVDIINFGQLLSTWWPLILIMIGIIQLFYRHQASKVSGFMFLFVGVFFLVNQVFNLNVGPYLVPFLLIIIGIIIIFHRFNRGKRAHTDTDLNTFALFSGAEIRSQSQNFRGGSVTTIVGGAEIDLRDAHIVDGAMLYVTSVLGGASVMVPENVQVEVTGIPILGGWEDSTRRSNGEGEVIRLKLHCLTILGGAEIKN
ncbi:LiaF transmembrane domain-containing protein [Gracilibacillus timonensis]|uniref:LiaF transmembrane domain-containing protein n=1 Tax=Gracilibacillus timonensis TaxID=1816696 RepID=UPI000826ADF7|nr:DUF5668 domain-containing protein [Gracilibacillus timonensis]